VKGHERAERPDGRKAAEPLPGWMKLVLAMLVCYRIVYHCAYLDVSPFALVPFSDGRLYELAALDILENPPLGSEPFYLQGLYAYFLALPMVIAPRIGFGLLLQLAVSGFALWLFFRAAVRAWGREVAGLCTIVLLAYPALAFYENKYLTAGLAVTCSILVLASAGWLRERPSVRNVLVFGMMAGLGILTRPNMLLAIPFYVWALVLVLRRHQVSRARAIGVYVLGLALVLSPLALRNLVVTGRATVFPAHGGGTSFYIGNNPTARGVWNKAGGLLSGGVVHERAELVEQLGIEDVPEVEVPAEIGRRLYARAFEYIADQPGHFAWLQVRKAWLTLGHDEIAQDYDPYGEREMLPWSGRVGLPFGVLVALGFVGFVLRWPKKTRPALVSVGDGPQPGQPRGRDVRPWLVVLLGQVVAVVAANVIFFTSSQHRLPLVVPLAFVAGPALVGLWHGFVRGKESAVAPWPGRPRRWLLLVAAALFVQSLWPRLSTHEPTAVHYHNLALAQDEAGSPRQALETCDRALERAPDHAVIRLQRARLARRLREYDKAKIDLDRIDQLTHAATWVRNQAALERQLLAIDRAYAEQHGLGPR
jgi:hypothetical protein